jgi:hypothetical protein
MARTIEEAFTTLHTRMTPTATESAQAKAHRASIKSCLEANFGMRAFFRSGSFGNATSVSGHSDVDYFAEIPGYNVPLSSSSFIHRVFGVLDARFPHTGVRLDAPALVLPFGTDSEETTDVVPAELKRTTWRGHRVYAIAGIAGWVESSPDAHGAYVDEVNEKLSRKVKPLIRFVKGWKYYNTAPVSSFYLELFVAKYAAKETSIHYCIDVAAVLQDLAWSGFAAVEDPSGISGSVPACDSPLDLLHARRLVEEAARHAAKARDAEAGGSISGAFGWWDKVFNYRFPAFG